MARHTPKPISKKPTKSSKKRLVKHELLTQIPFTDDEFRKFRAQISGSVDTTWCSAVVVSATGHRCDSAECQTFVGKKHWFRCEDGKCPAEADVWFAIPHDCGSGGTKWLTGCLVQYGQISTCS
jgi:hypothetical protein